jgi:hypothetical protein
MTKGLDILPPNGGVNHYGNILILPHHKKRKETKSCLIKGYGVFNNVADVIQHQLGVGDQGLQLGDD